MLTVYQDKGERVERNQLPNVVTTPRGDRSSKWKGIAHGELVDSMGRAIADIGYGIRKTELVVSGGKTDPQSTLVGGFELDTDGYGGLGQTVSQCVAFIHDNAGLSSLKIFTGGHVAICANGLVSAENRSRRKHTSGLNLAAYLAERFENLRTLFAETQQRTEILASHVISGRDHRDLMIAAARNNVLSWSSLGKLDRLWNDAKRGPVGWELEDRQGEWPFRCSAWDWYNAGTHVLKNQGPINQVLKLQKLEAGLQNYLAV